MHSLKKIKKNPKFSEESDQLLKQNVGKMVGLGVLLFMVVLCFSQPNVQMLWDLDQPLPGPHWHPDGLLQHGLTNTIHTLSF